MEYHYVIKVGFDDENADVVETRNYFDFMTRFNAIGIGCDREGTSHLIFNSDKKLDKKQISKELGGLAVLAFNVSEIKAA